VVLPGCVILWLVGYFFSNLPIIKMQMS